jgi:ADP-heptose:LPS heptosyltransferase
MTAENRERWVLVVRLRQLGDVLASLEVLRAIRRSDPSRRVAFVVDAPYASLVRAQSFVDRVLAPPRSGATAWVKFLREVRALRAEAAIDLHGSARSALITRASGAPRRVGFDVRLRRHAYTVVEPRGEFRNGRRVPHHPIRWGMRLARHVGAGGAAELPPAFDIDDGEKARALARLRGAGVAAGRRVVGLNPGRPVSSKSWAPERFVALARVLRDRGLEPVVFWGPGEENTARGIAADSGARLAPAFALEELPAALSACAALVTIDSGLKHLAVCARVPTVTVFGSTDPREWHMGGARDAVVWKALSCSPCRRLECPFGAPCMDVGVEAVLAALGGVLEESA